MKKWYRSSTSFWTGILHTHGLFVVCIMPLTEPLETRDPALSLSLTPACPVSGNCTKVLEETYDVNSPVRNPFWRHGIQCGWQGVVRCDPLKGHLKVHMEHFQIKGWNGFQTYFWVCFLPLKRCWWTVKWIASKFIYLWRKRHFIQRAPNFSRCTVCFVVMQARRSFFRLGHAWAVFGEETFNERQAVEAIGFVSSKERK